MHQNTQPLPVAISEVAEVFTGLSLSGRSLGAKDTGNFSIRVIFIADLDGTSGLVKENISNTIRVESLKKIDRYTVTKDDVLLSCRGTTTKAAIYPGNPEPTVISSNIIAIRPGQRLLAAYLLAFLQSAQGQAAIKEKERGMVQKVLTLGDVASITLPVPPLEQQRKIADLMSTANQAYNLALETAQQRRKVAYQIAS